MLEPDDWIASVERGGAAIAATDPDELGLAVPTCPGWTVRDLIVHTGAVHRWATTFLQQGPESRERFGFIDDDAPDDAAVTDWYRERLDTLVHELRSHDPDEPARFFGGRTIAAFWMRRQAHEIAVRRWDGENAAARAVPIDAELAADGIAEWAEVFAGRFLSRGSGLPEEAVGRTVHLHGVDGDDAEFTLTLARRDVTIERSHTKADVALRGTASDLALALWRRVPLTALELYGRTEVADTLLEAIQIT